MRVTHTPCWWYPVSHHISDNPAHTARFCLPPVEGNQVPHQTIATEGNTERGKGKGGKVCTGVIAKWRTNTRTRERWLTPLRTHTSLSVSLSCLRYCCPVNRLSSRRNDFAHTAHLQPCRMVRRPPVVDHLNTRHGMRVCKGHRRVMRSQR